MNGIAITSDSTCDLSVQQIRENEIGIMPLSVMLGDKSFRDGVDIVPADIFRFFEETGNFPKQRRRASRSTRIFSARMSRRAKRSSISIFPRRRAGRTDSRRRLRRLSAER